MRLNTGLGLVLASAVALAGCASTQDPNRAAVEYRGTGGTAQASPGPATARPAAPVATPGGIVQYDGYEAIIARQGDTVASLAERVGLSASELGAYNGLAPSQPLRPGDELVLPPRPGGYGGTAVAAATGTALSGAGLSGGAFGTAPAASEPEIEAAPLGTGGTPAAPAATGASSTGGWSPDLAAAAIDRAAPGSAPEPAVPGTQSQLTRPPSSATPLPSEPEQPADLASPNLGQYQTPSPSTRPPVTAEATERAAAEADRAAEQQLAAVDPARSGQRPSGTESLSLLRPVDGPVVAPYDTWGPGGTRNEGVDFGAPAGTPVRAALDGNVALVSPSLGGLGTIVVVRHANEILTVYGRIDGVTVAKGATIRRGQTIGQVASPPPGSGEPRMHFEVRRGASSLDPMLFF